MQFHHIPVLFNETLDALAPEDGGIYADGTLGGGGHSSGILRRAPKARLIGIDRDSDAICAAGERLSEFSDRVTLVNRNFSEIKSILHDLSIDAIDGAVLDLGVSSYQLDNGERGFGYMHDAPLDMRMDRRCQKSAYSVINEYSADELTRIFYEYGEEKWSKRIAQFIDERRRDKPVETTGELVDIIKAAVPRGARESGGHPAKRVFQAVRIEVNGEMELLPNALNDFIDCLKSGGRLAVITFHSLEDRIVKRIFAQAAKGCICPPSLPVCVCGKKPSVKIISRKPILPDERETAENSRSKSAKLRVIEKL